jgi:hypothetical protein
MEKIMINHAENFEKQKSMTKSEVMKLKPLTWIVLKWRDSKNSVALLLERPKKCKGDVSLLCLYPRTGSIDNHPTHEQIVGTLGMAEEPALVLGPKKTDWPNFGLKDVVETVQSKAQWALSQYKGRNLDLNGLDLKGVVFPRKVDGDLDLRDCTNLDLATLPLKVKGSLNVGGCDLKGVTLPDKIKLDLDLRGCGDLTGVVLPTKIGRNLLAQLCSNIDDLVIPDNCEVFD